LVKGVAVGVERASDDVTPAMPVPVRKEMVPWMEMVLGAVSTLPGKLERFCAVMG